MPDKQRKVEFYRLTISGLPEGTGYGTFIRKLRGKSQLAATMVMRSGDKSHALKEASLRKSRLRLRFLSYTKGHRPDILDTNRFSLEPNPLSPDQTNVEWTHAIGAKKGNRYLLLIERNNSGIWPSTIERYIQSIIEKFYEPPEKEPENEPITVTLEAEPGPEFLDRINSLDRITEATIRVARPNPGWRDLQDSLGENAGASDAQKVAITMTSRRRATLSKVKGIMKWIKEAFLSQELGFAAVKGYAKGRKEEFNTEKLGMRASMNFELDERGQVRAEDAWKKLSKMMDEID
jgi:hypothetical protein